MARTFIPPGFYLTNDDSFEHHGAMVLLLVRNGVCRDWHDLCRALRFDLEKVAYHSGHVGLQETIERLLRAGLLESDQGHLGPFRVAATAHDTIRALGLSLTQTANLLRYSGIAVRPFFMKPHRLPKAAHVFVVMPFDKQMRPVFTGPIKAACRRIEFSVERGDDIFSGRIVVEDIWAAIMNCFVVVADCTGRNPNVFYELGIAHAVGKPVILLTQAGSDTPFDVNHLRQIRYQPTPMGLKQLQDRLVATFRQLQAEVWIPEVEVRRRRPRRTSV